MKKILFLIIGIVTLLLTNPVHAESARNQDTHFCGPGRPTPQFSLYKRAYCGAIATDDNSDILKAVAAQFELEDPAVIQKIIDGEPLKPDEITDRLRIRYAVPLVFNAYSIIPLTADVLSAYEKEKVIDRMKRNFKQEFKSSEQWYNAALFDAPMDLVVDLNLIDVMLFGSQAQWNNDVYRFPGSEDDESEPSPSSDDPNGNESSEEGPNTDSDSTGDEPPFDPAGDCVPPDSPDAIPLSPGEIPPACGNNVLDSGEQCDDGNNISGDGCGNTCHLEDVGTILCRDPEAITFRDFQPVAPSSNGAPAGPPSDDPNVDDTPASCPPGTRPRQGLAHDAPGPAPLPQSPNYPGPFVGGVLKNIALTIPPPCPAGESPIQIQYADPTSATSETLAGIPRCVPTKWCADPNDVKSLMDKVRAVILGPAWADQADTKKIGDSIEAIFCAKVTTANRPEPPYEVNEGCIDCQIQAMNKTLDELLQYQIAPMENTRNAFGISNRWGPQFSFDLNLSMPSNPEKKVNQKVDALKEFGAVSKKIEQNRVHGLDPNAEIAQSDVVRYENLDTLTAEFKDFNQKQDEQAFRELKSYRANNDASKVQILSQDLTGLLNAWQRSFANVQNVFLSLTDTLKFSDLNQCQ